MQTINLVDFRICENGSDIVLSFGYADEDIMRELGEMLVNVGLCDNYTLFHDYFTMVDEITLCDVCLFYAEKEAILNACETALDEIDVKVKDCVTV